MEHGNFGRSETKHSQPKPFESRFSHRLLLFFWRGGVKDKNRTCKSQRASMDKSSSAPCYNMCDRLMRQYPGRVPVIFATDNHAIAMSKTKFLVPSSICIAQLVHVLRQHVGIDKSESLFITTEDGVIPPVTLRMDALYATHRHDDGMLRLFYNVENTFG